MRILLFISMIGAVSVSQLRAEVAEVDLLIVGGGESACAAAVQAARLGVKRIALVSDVAWLGGQFSSEGLGCLDETTTVGGRKVNFPRSGLFLEIVMRIRNHHRQTYGVATPGNAYCGTDTVTPAVAAQIFEELLAPYTTGGSKQIAIHRNWEPTEVALDGNRLSGVTFARPTGGEERLSIRCRLCIDASDFGDAIRLSGAKYSAGPDARSRFGEPSAPETVDKLARQEMNPITYCLVLRHTGKDSTIAKPASYDPLCFGWLDATPWFVESTMIEGCYAQTGWSVYTHRRLVDQRHGNYPGGQEVLLLNWPVQDYPLYDLPRRVRDALEATEPGSSQKNLVELTPAQRRIVFEDAKQHALSMLYHLQTAIDKRDGSPPTSAKFMELTDEFGTPDRLPLKPYVRESLRLDALYMVREQDVRTKRKEPGWAAMMPEDGLFGYQFNIDFHPTRRKYLTDDKNGPWQFEHTPSRNWHTDTDRAMFPLRSVVPLERDGLLGAGRNVGVSSVVQSALRVHGQMVLMGQSAGTVAWLCLRDDLQPRQVAASRKHWQEAQVRLANGVGGPGVLLWPWHDLSPEEAHFPAANLLAMRGIWQADADSVNFAAAQPVSRREGARALARLMRSLPDPKPWLESTAAVYVDVPPEDSDRAFIESLISWGDFGPPQPRFLPAAPLDWTSLHRWLNALGLPAPAGLKNNGTRALTRGELVQILWQVVSNLEPNSSVPEGFLQPGSDSDGDGIADLDDALPLDRNNNSIADLVDLPPAEHNPTSN